MNLIIGADIVPTATNAELFSAGAAETLVGHELMNILQSADFRIFNLEVPLTDVCSPIKKHGPALIASTQTIHGIKNTGVNLLTLANNHIMDQGAQGLISTLEVLKENGIDYIGVGKNLSQMKHSYIIEKCGIKIGVYACAEHEFSIAEEDRPGANPFDPLESMDCIYSLSQSCDFVIVLYHGGKEHYRYPSPMLRKACRKMVEKGASLVVTQHSHCIGCEEKYRNGTIVYGQGNFLFDHSTSEFWQTSLLIQLELDKNKMNVQYIPLRKTGNTVRKADKADGREIMEEFRKRSEEIKSEEFVKQTYKRFAAQMSTAYINSIYMGGFFFRAINKLCGHRLNKKLSERKKRMLRNYIECEAHRELLLGGLEE